MCAYIFLEIKEDLEKLIENERKRCPPSHLWISASEVDEPTTKENIQANLKRKQGISELLLEKLNKKKETAQDALVCNIYHYVLKKTVFKH